MDDDLTKQKASLQQLAQTELTKEKAELATHEEQELYTAIMERLPREG